ncbi:protein kinase [bacterium]|nr:protein kinase [bacterium]
MTIVHSLQSAGPYHLAERLGFNGVVATYKAFEKETEMLACVVVIEQSALQNAGAFTRFTDEFSSLVQAPASRVCQPLRFGTDAGFHWASYEYVKGRHLGNFVREEGLPTPGRSVDLIAQSVEALKVMHSHQVPHRLVTPASIMINDIEKVKLMHAGWGGLLLGVADGAANPAFLSNLPFLAPEVAFGGEGDEASDVYSLGANLYFLLTGRPTHWASDPPQLLQQIQTEAVDLSPLQEIVPGEVIQVVEEMLQPDPDDRPVNLEALFGRLDSLAAWLISGEQFNPEDGVDGQRLSAGEIYAQYVAGNDEVPNDQLTTVEVPVERGAGGDDSTIKQVSHLSDDYPDEPAPQEGYQRAEELPPLSQNYQAAPHSLADQIVEQQPAPEPNSPNQSIEAQRQAAERSGTGFTAMPAAEPLGSGQYATGTAPAKQEAEYLAVLEEEHESPGERKNRILLMAVSGGLVLLALFIWAITTVIGVLTKAPAPKQNSNRPVGLQAQYQAELLASKNYQDTVMKLRRAGDFNRQFIARNGVWASSVDDLIAEGAEMPAVTDAWGREFDIRDEFVVCAGEDGKWDNKDDFWYDCRAEEIGGYEPKFDLPENSPVIGDVNRQLNDVMNKAMDQQMMMREAIEAQERMSTGNWSRNANTGSRQDNNDWANQPFDPRFDTSSSTEEGGDSE